MTNEERRLTDEELRNLRDLAAATHLSASVHLIIRSVGIDSNPSNESVNLMIIDMIEPVNAAVEAAWCALMQDRKGVDRTVSKLKETLNAVIHKYESGGKLVD